MYAFVMIFKEQVEILKDLEHGIVMFNILSKKILWQSYMIYMITANLFFM